MGIHGMIQKLDQLPVWLRKSALWAVVLFSLVSFIYNGILRIDTWHDYYQWYSAGRAWLEKADLYSYDGFRSILTRYNPNPDPVTAFYYPQFVAMVFSPLALLPIAMGFKVYLLLEVTALAALILILGLLIRQFKPITLADTAFLAALLNTSFTRSAFRLSNISLFIGLLYFLSYWLYRLKKPVLSGISMGLIASKPLFLPLLGLFYLLKRSWRLILAAVPVVIGIILIPAVISQLSLVTLFKQLAAIYSTYSKLGVNDPSPLLLNNYLQNLEPLIYRLFNAESQFTKILSGIIVVLLLAASAYLLYRRPSTTAISDLLDFSLMSTLSMLVVYRRMYDSFLYFPGIIFFYLLAASLKDSQRKFLFYALAIGFLILYTLPGDLIVRFSFSQPALVQNYFFRLLAPYQAWMGVLLFAILFWIKVHWKGKLDD